MKTRTDGVMRRSLQCFLVAGICASLASAGPEGAEIVNGTATFVHNGVLTRIWVSDGAIINYASFNIATGETVRFIQPGANARVLNRILGAEPTRIDGNLISNGQVYMVNPAGVVFGQGAVVNVGALYAAAANISDQDFVAGNNHFTGASGSVVNHGYISSDFVALIGGRVANHGQIKVGDGAVVMAAGEDILIGERFGSLYVRVEGAPDRVPGSTLGSSGDAGLDMAAGDVFSLAAWNTGTIQAGTTHVEASHGRTVVSGVIDAADRGDGIGIGGDVRLLGQTVELRGATIDASGKYGGGNIWVGGDLSGSGDMRRARWTLIDANSSLSVDARNHGHGGRAIIWSDRGTVVDGQIYARGGRHWGDGGFVETSSLGGLHLSNPVNASATNGKGGHWLIDPTGILIFPGSGGSLTVGGGFVQAAGAVTSASIGDAVINAVLNMGMDLTITTDNPAASVNGNIELQFGANIIKSMGGDATLTLRAADNIVLYGDVLSSSGVLNLNLISGDPAQAGQLGHTPVGLTAMTGSIDLNGGALSVAADWVYVAPQNFLGAPVEIHAQTIDFLARNAGNILVQGDLFFDGQLAGTEFGVRMIGGAIDIHSLLQSGAGSQSGAQFQNSGRLSLFPTADLRLTGPFEQIGSDVWLGADISTTQDSILFDGDITLLDSVLLDTGDALATGSQVVRFGGAIDSATSGMFAGPHSLSVDAGGGTLLLMGDVGSLGQLAQITLRGRETTIQSVYTTGQQTYTADTLRMQGAELISSLAGRIRVLDESLPASSFVGNTILENDVLVRTAGAAGDNVVFRGTVDSMTPGGHTLAVDAGAGGLVTFVGSVGAGGPGHTLDTLRTTALETRFWGPDVMTLNGMTFHSPVEIAGASTTFDTGLGTGFFNGHVYSREGVFADIAFAYMGDASIGLGTARAPFVFAGNLGDVGTGAFNRAFNSITLGGDLTDPAASASFVFANADLLPNGLIDAGSLDTTTTHRLVTRGEGLFTGLGQKITAFGNLEMLATGPADGTRATLQFGDVNVLGDFSATATDPDGSRIVFRVRDAGEIESSLTEQLRLMGLPADLLADQGMEVIAGGEIHLSADRFEVLQPFPGAGYQLAFASDSGTTVATGDQVIQFPGTVNVDLFRSALNTGQLYPYDLTFASTPPGGPDLGLAFIDEAQFEPGYTDRYLAEREVLQELRLSPRDVSVGENLNGVRTGRKLISDYPSRTQPDPDRGDYAVAIERVSRPAIARLTAAYIAVFGERIADEGPASPRANDERIARVLGGAWDRFEQSSAEPTEFHAWLEERAMSDDEASQALVALTSLRDVLARLDQVELTRFERRMAAERVLERVRSGKVGSEEFREAVGGERVVAAR